MQDGLIYTTPVEEKGAGLSQTLIWPGALVSFRGQTFPLQLLKSSTYANEELMLTRAVNDLEYELTNTIRKLNSVVKPRVAFIEGHGELDSLETKDLNIALKEYYTVARIRLDSNLSSLIYRTQKEDSLIFVPRYSAIVIAKPDSAFSEKDKFLIDQYLIFYTYEFQNGCNTHPHNIYLQFLSELGFVGFALFVFMFFYIFFNLLLLIFKHFKKSISIKEKCMASILFGLFISMFPLFPSGNYFNNWLLIITYLPIGFYISLVNRND
jgi:hypothetical protein